VTETSAHEHRWATTPVLRDTPKLRIPWGIRDGQQTSATAGVFFAAGKHLSIGRGLRTRLLVRFGAGIAILSCASTAASAGELTVRFAEGTAGGCPVLRAIDRGESRLVFPFADGSL